MVGLQERFDEFCDELAGRYGWDLGPPQFANRSQPMDVDEDLRARIARDNAFDVELYSFAAELVAASLPDERDLAVGVGRGAKNQDSMA